MRELNSCVSRDRDEVKVQRGQVRIGRGGEADDAALHGDRGGGGRSWWQTEQGPADGGELGEKVMFHESAGGTDEAMVRFWIDASKR